MFIVAQIFVVYKQQMCRETSQLDVYGNDKRRHSLLICKRKMVLASAPHPKPAL
jgi:hypothetical protein